MPTPATEGERGSLMGARSPVPSLDICRPHGQFGADSAIPGLDIDPPNLSYEGGSKPSRSDSQQGNGDRSEGIGGWISNMVGRHRGADPSSSSQYRRLEQGGEADEE